jgi:regulator of protease activity HflC (stomatin/prohibitin superfamily)
MDVLIGAAVGFAAWFMVRYFLSGLYTVNQNERAVKTIFGRAERIPGRTTLDDPIAEHLRPDEKERYTYPQVRVIPPGGPYFKWPWERIHKISVATQTINMAYDPEDPTANRNGTMLDAVTKDQLNIGLNGQIRFQISERNMYAYLFGVKAPFIHVMGYFISVLRERIANFQAPAGADPALTDGTTNEEASIVSGVSINDLRKNLRDLNEHMERECLSSVARYGISLDASLITGIDPPPDVESALAAINTAHNHVSSDISLAQASADQRIVQSRRAVEIETLNAQAEIEPLNAMAGQLAELKQSGPTALPGYMRNVRLRLFSRAGRAIVEIPNRKNLREPGGGPPGAKALGSGSGEKLEDTPARVAEPAVKEGQL